MIHLLQCKTVRSYVLSGKEYTGRITCMITDSEVGIGPVTSFLIPANHYKVLQQCILLSASQALICKFGAWNDFLTIQLM